MKAFTKIKRVDRKGNRVSIHRYYMFYGWVFWHTIDVLKTKWTYD